MSSLTHFVALAGLSLSISQVALAAEPYPNTSNFGVPFSEDESWYQQCMRVAKLESPEMTRTNGEGASCHAEEMYYIKLNQAVTSQAEWDRVRACAGASGNHAVLMMLYANGYGVPRDTGMAIHYACKLKFVAKAEMEYRVKHLAAARAADVRFDQCDDITSGAMEAVCAAIRERQDERVRNARLARISKMLSPAGRQAFSKLRAAAERYAVEGVSEVDARGTAAAALSYQRQARLREQFMQAVLDAFNGKLPVSSPEEYARQDDDLNALYQTIEKLPSTQDGWPDRIGLSTISHTAIRNTERAWLAYRDAFIAFMRTLPSGSQPVAVKTLLTSQRIAQLNEMESYR